MADDRDLTLKITADAEQAKAEVDSLSAKVGEFASTEGLATGATKEAADAQATLNQRHVEAEGHLTALSKLHNQLIFAQQEARAAMAALGEATVAGGAKMVAAMEAAKTAVAGYEIAQDRVRSGGGIVSPGQIAELAVYDATLERLSVTTGKVSSETKAFGIEASLARGNVGGLARGVASMGGDFASAALPIAAGAALLSLLPTIIDKIDSTTKKWSESLVDMVMGIKEETAAEERADAAVAKHDASLKHAADTHEQFMQAEAGMVAGVIEETTNVARAVAAWQGHHAAMNGNFELYPQFVEALKKMGVTFRATHEEMTAEAELFFLAYKTAVTRDGIGAEKAWLESNKGALDKILSYYEEIGQKPPAALLRLAQSIGLVTKAEAEAAKAHLLREKFVEDMNAAALLAAQLAASSREFGSSTTAALGMRAELEKQITALENLKTANAAEEAQRLKTLASLNAYAVQAGILTGKLGETARAHDDLVKKIANLDAELEKNQRAYEASIRKVNEHRDASLRAAQDTEKATISSIDAQIAALERQVSRGELSQSEYVERIAALQWEEVEVKRRAQVQEDAINADAAAKLLDLTDKDTEAKVKIQKNLEDLNISRENAKKVHDELLASEQLAVKALQEQQKAMVDTTVATGKHAETQAQFAKDEKAAATETDAATEKLTQHHAIHERLQTTIPKTTKVVADLRTGLDGLLDTLAKVGTALDETFGGGTETGPVA